jgi:ATP-dependent exoDNAse (exonuclease V) beta subunit
MADILQFPPSLSSNEGSVQPKRPPDYEARERALDIHRSCIVEAPAGSGKTGLLLQRYLKLLAEGCVEQPEEVLAITFTRKATAELRERVLAHLHSASSAAPLSPRTSPFDRETRALSETVLAIDAKLGWNLLNQPQRLRISTIDSVCGEIARALPLLSGSAASRPVDDARLLYREAARRTLMRLGGADTNLTAALRTVLLHRDGNLNDCETLLARMLQQREQWKDLVPLDSEALTEERLELHVRPRLERSLEAIVTAGLERALNAMPPGSLERFSSLAARLAREPGYDGQISPIAICADRSEPPAASVQDLDHWIALIGLVLKASDGEWRARFNKNDVKFLISREDAHILKDLVETMHDENLRITLHNVLRLPPLRYPDDQWRVAKALFHLLRDALAELKVLFGETGQCDFSELSLAARNALEDGGAIDLANSPSARLNHLLVDEMQDTSSSQYALLELLTRSWDGCSQTIFLVGDPKQSIYLFRQARVERFLRTVREGRLGEIQLDTLQLTANFRSQGALVEAFNDTFSQIFPASTNPCSPSQAPDVSFVHADSIRISAPDSIEWHAAVIGDGTSSDPESDLRAAHARYEARSIRRIIEDWRARPLPSDRRKREDGTPESWRIAILARARTHFPAIVAELSRDVGSGPISYRAVEIDPLSERSEVLDVLALTRALLHPADRTAWLAVLRAPWCGLGLLDLLALTGEGDGADPQATVAELVASRNNRLSPEGQGLLARAWRVLAHATETLGRSPIAVQIERTWQSLGGDLPLSPEARINVRRFFEIVRDLESSGRIDITILGARLDDLYAEPGASDHAVELLTIHNSKGLEFDLVLVPGLERPAARTSSDLLNWLELDSIEADAAHIMLAPIGPRGEDSDLLNDWLSRVRSSREDAETKRLMYVACTRAREELHLFAALQRRKDGSLRRPKGGTLLHASWPAAIPRFENPASPWLVHVNRSSAPQEPWEATGVSSEWARNSGLALAAAAEPLESQPSLFTEPPIVHRLPSGIDPLARFASAESTRLPYIAASALPNASAAPRPEGSFGVRAFGNVVHRFLQLVSARLEQSNEPEVLLLELPTWEPRLVAALRGEGLAPSYAQRAATRALTALQNTLLDPIGRWILSPHPGASSERSLATSGYSVQRADRTFFAGTSPLSLGEDSIWIVDFKTTEQGSRSAERFAQDEILKYHLQLQRYATILRALPHGERPIHLALFYPLIPRLLRCSDEFPTG